MENYNKFIYYINKIIDIIFISILWTVCSLPVFTLGASTITAYECIHGSVFHDQGYVFRTFFSAFRKNLKTGCLITLLFLPACLLSALSLYLTSQQSLGNLTYLFLILSILVFAACFLCLLHLCCIAARFQYPVNTLVQLVITVLAKDIFQNILLLFLFICVLDLVIYYPPSLFFVPGVYLVLCYIIEEQIFRKHIKNL